jgi:hypothetical protein
LRNVPCAHFTDIDARNAGQATEALSASEQESLLFAIQGGRGKSLNVWASTAMAAAATTANVDNIEGISMETKAGKESPTVEAKSSAGTRTYS